MAGDKLILRERAYIPIKLVSIEDVKRHYSRRMYDNKLCARCEYREERHSHLCDPCEGYRGQVKLYKQKEIGGRTYVGLPIGDKAAFASKLGVDFKRLKVVDKRTDVPFNVNVKFTLDLREGQVAATSDWLKKKYGILVAPPRTGKTAMMLKLGVALGQRFVVLANQHEFLTQFMDHVYGNPDEDIPQCTNIPELEQKYNRKLAGFPRKDEDYENFQIFVMTYQQYLSEKSGKQRFSKISKNVGSMFIDEAHKGASNGFAEVLQRFPVKYRGGVTATLDRKDGRSFILKHIIGPKTAESSVDSLIPTVYAHETGFTTNRMFTGRAGWVRANQALARDKKRNAMIVDYVMKDLAKGHNIVIPVYFKKHAFELQQLINDAWTAAGHDKPICTTFVGGGGKKNKADRKQKLSEAKLNHFRVTVGIRSLLQLGLNVPAWSAIYTALPISNEPNYKQETSRVRTPKEGKRQPIVRVFFEEGLGVSIGCARNCMKQMAKFGYAFSSTPKQRRLFAILANSGRRSEPVDLGDADYKPHRAFLDEKPKGKQPRKPLLSSRRV